MYLELDVGAPPRQCPIRCTTSAAGSPQPEPTARSRDACRYDCLCPLTSPSANSASAVTDSADSTSRVPQSGSPPSTPIGMRSRSDHTIHRQTSLLTSESARHRRHSADAPTSLAVRRRPRPPRQSGGALSRGIKGSGKSSWNYTHITSYPRSSDLLGISEHPGTHPHVRCESGHQRPGQSSRLRLAGRYAPGSLWPVLLFGRNHLLFVLCTHTIQKYI